MLIVPAVHRSGTLLLLLLLSLCVYVHRWWCWCGQGPSDCRGHSGQLRTRQEVC